jgi:hypothetical protein
MPQDLAWNMLTYGRDYTVRAKPPPGWENRLKEKEDALWVTPITNGQVALFATTLRAPSASTQVPGRRSITAI